jgi:WD40 repeat protein
VNGQFTLINTTTWSVIETYSLPASFDITVASFDSTASSLILSTRSRERTTFIWNVDQGVVVNSIDASGLYDSIEDVKFLNDKDVALLAYPSGVALFHIASSKDDLVQYTLNIRNFSVAEISMSGNYFARGGVEATGDAVTDGLPIIGQSDHNVYLHRLPRIHDELQRPEARKGLCIKFKQGSSRELFPVQCPISEPIRSFRGHTDIVTSIAFDTIDKYLVTGSKDGTVKVWLLNS